MKYSIITTCKGRLHYLLRVLPSFVAQPDTEVIVVDYDCPQETARVVDEKFPGVRTLKVDNQPKFNLSAARNAGAAVAQGEFLVFVDSDIVLENDFSPKLVEMPTGAYGEWVGPNDVRGTCVIPAEVFRLVEGYDEVIIGYGCEDLELYARLRYAGLQRHIFPIELLREVIPNTAEERILFHDVGRKLSYARGKAYRDLKLLLLKISGSLTLPLELRLELWSAIDAITRSPDIFDHEHYLEVPLPASEPDGMLPNCTFASSVRLTIKLVQ